MKTFSPFLIVILFAGAMLFTGCKQSDSAEDTTAANPQPQTESSSNRGQAYIDDESDNPHALRIALNSPDHTTLVAAVEAAEVQNSLVNVGPLTVFAPTNAAFDKLPAGTVEELLKPENKARLAYILKNHVAPSNYPLETLQKNVDKGRKLYMASGENVEVTRDGEDILVNGTRIIASVKASNGWVHITEDVILPQD